MHAGYSLTWKEGGVWSQFKLMQCILQSSGLPYSQWWLYVCVYRCVDYRSQSTQSSIGLHAVPTNVSNNVIPSSGSGDGDDEDLTLLPPVNLKNLCARHWVIRGISVQGVGDHTSAIVNSKLSHVYWDRKVSLNYIIIFTPLCRPLLNRLILMIAHYIYIQL